VQASSVDIPDGTIAASRVPCCAGAALVVLVVGSGEGIDCSAEGAGWVDGVEGSVGCAAPGEV
jgi:hypothetical protein